MCLSDYQKYNNKELKGFTLDFVYEEELGDGKVKFDVINKEEDKDEM